MNLDDFKPQWRKRQRDLDGSVNHVIEEVHARMSSFDRTIWWRDMRETLVALGLLLWYCFSLFQPQSFLSQCGAGLGVLACIIIVGVLHWARRKGKVARNDLPVEKYCKAELTRVDRQIWLLRNIHWWYLGPLFVAVVVQVAATKPEPSGLIKVLTFILPFFGFIYWLNRVAIRNQLLPLRDEIVSAMVADEGRVSIANVDTQSSPKPTKSLVRETFIAVGLLVATGFFGAFLSERMGIDPNAPTVSPFTEMRFENSEVIVSFQDADYRWLELDGIKVEDIVTAAKRRFWGHWEKRVSEDLVGVLWAMEHHPGDTVTLRLLDTRTKKERFIEKAPMTRENRSEVYWNRTLAERKTASQPPDELSDEQVRDLEIDTRLRRRLEGRYQLNRSFIFDVQDHDGHLMIGITNQQTQEVFPDSATRWSYRSVDAMLEFKLGSDGPAKRLILHQNDMQQSAIRIEE